MDYGSQAARWLLGASAHPGGLALSRQLVDHLALRPGSRVADVACGRGATIALLAELGHTAVGVDLAPGRTRAGRGARGRDRPGGAGRGARGRDRPGDEGRGARVVVAGDAHALPLGSAALDAVVCECALSTFDRPDLALAEMRRVLRPGGLVGLTDVILDRERAAPAVTRAVDRLTTARTLASYVELITAAGFRVTATEDHGDAASALLTRLRHRLPLSGAVRECAHAVRDGSLSYALLVAAVT